ncbi:MAG: putative rane protein [Myxococcales bacterium]|nr:putative rane protein [Myxococcales bacterium]
MTVALLCLLGVVALAAFATEGAIGFGGTVLAASIGAQLVPLEVLLPAFVPLNIALSTWLLASGVREVAWRYLATHVAPAVAVGAAIGLALFHVQGKTVLSLVFGIFVVVLAALQLAKPAARPLGGVVRIGLLVLGGVAHGLFGTGGPMIVYVVRRQLPDKKAFRATLAVLWLVLNTALLVNFAGSSLYGREVAITGGVLAFAIVPGLVIGERLHRKLDPARFERVVWILLLVAGTALAVRSAINLA